MPGGVLSLSTEFRLTGPPGGIGWPGMTLLFSKENLLRYIEALDIDAHAADLLYKAIDPRVQLK